MKGFLKGLDEYLAANYERSIFDEAAGLSDPWVLHLHGGPQVEGFLTENLKFDIRFKDLQGGNQVIPKITVKFLYPARLSSTVAPLIKWDQKVKAMALGPIMAPGARYHIKNKTLYPAMEEKKVLFFKLLEGEVLKGMVSGFNRYEITLSAKGGVPITILRHAVYDLRDKKGRCLLKSFQNEHRDWEKSPLYVSG
jgi:sRNA-binding regulator protein Hfq